MKDAALLFVLLVIFSSRINGQHAEPENNNFKKADSIADLYPKHSLRDLRSLALKLTKPLKTEEDKFRSIYKWVCSNIENDYSLFKKNQHQRKKLKDPEQLSAWNKKFSIVVFRTLLEKQRTVCSGYAYLIREMARYAGIECVIIDGYGRTFQANVGEPANANHSWNAVRLNNNWYLCDPTWSSGVIDEQKAIFIKRFEPGYFLADPALFVRSHYPLDTAWMLLDSKPSLKSFLNSPVIYRSTFKHQLHPVFPETLNVDVSKGNKVSFQFRKNSDQVIDNTMLLIEGSKTMSVPVKFYRNDEGLYCIDHVFTSKGKFAVHVMADDQYVVSYQLRVR
jgi:transglutaminase/protease-like cytokinesis protein 3